MTMLWLFTNEETILKCLLGKTFGTYKKTVLDYQECESCWYWHVNHKGNITNDTVTRVLGYGNYAIQLLYVDSRFKDQISLFVDHACNMHNIL